MKLFKDLYETGAAFKAEEIPKFSKTSIGFLKKDKNKICKEIDKKFCECNVLESNLEKAETIVSINLLFASNLKTKYAKK